MKLEWLLESIEKKKKLPEKPYLASAASTPAPEVRKRTRGAQVKDTKDVKDESEEEDQEPPKKQARKTKVKTESKDEKGEDATNGASDGGSVEIELKKEKENGQKAISKDLVIPVDECFCDFGTFDSCINSTWIQYWFS